MNFEYPSFESFGVNFLLGKKEVYSYNYKKVLSLCSSYDKSSVGLIHREFEKFNYSFLVKFLVFHKNRADRVFDKLGEVDVLKAVVFDYIESEGFSGKDLLYESSHFFKSFGDLNSERNKLKEHIADLSELGGILDSEFEESVSSKVFLDFYNRGCVLIKNCVDSFNKIHKNLGDIVDHLMPFFRAVIKEKVRVIRKNVDIFLDDLIEKQSYETATKSFELSLRDSVNKAVKADLGKQFLKFKGNITVIIDSVPEFMWLNSVHSETKANVEHGFSLCFSGFLETALRIDYYDQLKIRKQNRSKVA